MDLGKRALYWTGRSAYGFVNIARGQSVLGLFGRTVKSVEFSIVGGQGIEIPAIISQLRPGIDA